VRAWAVQQLHTLGWHRLAHFGAYLCASAQEVRSRRVSLKYISSGYRRPGRVQSGSTVATPSFRRRRRHGVVGGQPRKMTLRSLQKKISKSMRTTLNSITCSDKAARVWQISSLAGADGE